MPLSEFTTYASSDEYQTKIAQAQPILAQAQKKWMRRTEVNSVGLGMELDKLGSPTGGVALHVYVKSKLPIEELQKRSVLPEFEGGLRVHVHQGRFRLAGLEGGDRVAPAFLPDDGGTVGIAVRDFENTISCLTAAHVVTGGRSPQEIASDPRLQSLVSEDSAQVVGTTIPQTIRLGGSVDGALFRPTVPPLPAQIRGFSGYPRTMRNPIAGESIFIFSRKTNKITTGVVASIGHTVDFGNGSRLFGQVFVSPTTADGTFAEPGDSGSAAIGPDSSLVGLLVGVRVTQDDRDTNNDVVCPIVEIARNCGFTLLR
ncbi:MAG: hypothetical protein NT069_24635 [Planctomycetota bacterium]|nr:hypothetical protein [Planctomycetota bacterium]